MGDTFISSPSTSSESPTPRPTRSRQLYTYSALVLTSTLASDQLARLSRQSRITVLSFPFSSSISFVCILYCAGRSERTPTNQPDGIGGLLNGLLSGKNQDTSLVWSTAISFVGSLAMRLWSLRWQDQVEGFAIDIFILPLLVLLYPTIAGKFSSTTGSQRDRTIEYLIAGMATFVGLTLLGRGGTSKAGLFFSIMKVPLEAIFISLMTIGMADGDLERRMRWMWDSALASTLLSILLLPIALFFPDQTFAPTFSPVSYLLAFTTVLLCALYTTTFLYSLSTFDSPLRPTTHLVPRNALCLLSTAFMTGFSALRGNQLQLFAVYLGGAGVTWYLLRRGESDERDQSISTADDSNHSNRPPPSTLPLVYLSLLPFLLFILTSLLHPSSQSSLSIACSQLPSSLRPLSCPPSIPSLPSRTVDLVIAYYNEDLPNTRSNLDYVRRVTFVCERNSRVILYNKGDRDESTLRQALGFKSWDKVIKMENIGREGATYLQHILKNYNDTLASISPASSPSSLPTVKPSPRLGLADHTFFLQHHLAWTGISKPRLWMIPSDVGYASFGPLNHSPCGANTGHGDFPLLKTVYNMFRGEICPPEGMIIAWSGQFVVSRRRILDNPYESYRELDEMLEAPEGHWLHNLWGPDGSGGPSNPTFGHTVERSWPTIFDCADPKVISQQCLGETVGFMKNCLCRDV